MLLFFFLFTCLYSVFCPDERFTTNIDNVSLKHKIVSVKINNWNLNLDARLTSGVNQDVYIYSHSEEKKMLIGTGNLKVVTAYEFISMMLQADISE